MLDRATEFEDQRRACDRADRLGIFCSGLCATHCLACPLLFSIMPAIAGSGLWGTNGAEKMLALASLVFAWFSVGPTLRSAPSRVGACLTVIGLIFVLATAFASHVHGESASVRHSANCRCAAYCGIPVGMCVAESINGDAQLIPLTEAVEDWAPGRSHSSLRGLLTTAGAVLLMIGHWRNFKARNSQPRFCRQDLLAGIADSNTASRCQGSGITSTLTSKRC
jgi:hypothetical protein